jgi:DNA-binding response OmpR family regulator
MENPVLSGRSILVVEDEPLIALEVKRVFENAGAYVFVATQLPRALQLAGHPDLSAAVLADRLGQEHSSAICSRLEQSEVPFMFYGRYEEAHQVWPNALRVSMSVNAYDLVEAVKGMFGSSFAHARSRAA